MKTISYELQQMLNMHEWEPVRKPKPKPNNKRNYIPAIMFLKENFLNWRNLTLALLEVEYIMQHGTITKENMTSPTVDTTSVFACTATAANEGLGVSTKDIKGLHTLRHHFHKMV